MSESGWFYLVGTQAAGPFSLEEMDLRRQAGTLPADTLVWSRQSGMWLAAQKAIPSLAAAAQTEDSPGAGDTASWLAGGVHPWRRLCARALDTLFHGCAAILVLILLLGANGIPVMDFLNEEAGAADAIIDPLQMALLAFPITAAVIGFSGTSIGKWLFGIVVLGDDGRPIGFQQGLRREFLVWLRGAGAAVLPIALVTAFLACRTLRRDGVTPWDARMGLRIMHRRAGRSQCIAAAAGTIILVALVVFYAFSIFKAFGAI